MKIRYILVLFLFCFVHDLFAEDYDLQQKENEDLWFNVILTPDGVDSYITALKYKESGVIRFVDPTHIPSLPRLMVDKPTLPREEKLPERVKSGFFFEYHLPKLKSFTSFSKLSNLKKQRLGLWFSHNPTREINISGMFGKKANSWKTTSSVEAEYYQKFGSFESLSVRIRASLGNIKVNNLSDGGDISAIILVKYNF